MIKNRTPEPAPEPETLSCRERNELAASRPNYYSLLASAPSRAEWAATLPVLLGKSHPSHLPEKCRKLYGKPLIRIFQEALYHDSGTGPGTMAGVEPPVGETEIWELFSRSVVNAANLRVRDGGGFSGGSAMSFANLIGTTVLSGYAEIPNSLAGIVRNAELPNFLECPIVQARDVSVMRPLAKGGTAADMTVDVASFGMWKLARYALKATITEEDLADDVPGSILTNIGQLGSAAKRTSLDLLWYCILSNPVLAYDSIELFDAVTHQNYGTAALTDTSLGAACAWMSGQTLLAPDSIGSIIHTNITPRVLLVPPALEKTAREILRLRKLDNAAVDLELRVESRLGPDGVLNPLNAAKATGSNTNCLLSADNTVAPWLMRGTLEGKAGPTTRIGNLPNGSGRYGLSVDVHQDLAAACVDFHGCYFSTGVSS
jgi:hypothetical protein